MNTEFILFSLLALQSIQCFLVPYGKVSVHSPIGNIVGYSTTLRIKGTERVIQKFLGIPYAEPPTGLNRFQKPIPKATFKTPFDATRFGAACYNLKTPRTNASAKIMFDEDCLRLNIFAPETGNAPLPVMVWIHGGGFISGRSNTYDAGPLSLSGDVIVVTINYRLNMFGFLSTSDPRFGGNWGLWDQHLAIKWVHDNIRAFGGDPSNVTIFGESAGSASVVYQTIYPGNKGLFQRAIAESGSIQSPWAFRDATEALNMTNEFAILAGCTKGDSVSIITCLQSKAGKELLNILNGPARLSGLRNWVPVMDGQFVTEDPKLFEEQFPSKQVEDMFHSVDLMIGVNNKEGFINFITLKETTQLNFTKSYIDNRLIPGIMKRFEFSKDRLAPSVQNSAVLEYTDWDHLDDDKKQFDRFIDLMTDYEFIVPAAVTAQKHTSSNQRTYVYKLSTAPPKHLLHVFSEFDGPSVANHGDDIYFLFGPWFLDRNTTATDEQENIGKAMITMWTNFAKTG